MFCTLVDLLEILKLVAQPLVGSARLLLTVGVFYLLASSDTGSVSDFTCHPETKDGATQECFSTYSAEMSSFMHPQFFVTITAVGLFISWSVMILYSYTKREKIRRASAAAIPKMKNEFWGKVLLHVRCEAVFLIVSLGLFCCTQKIILAETYNCIPRNAPVEIVLTCRHKRQQDKKDLNIYFIGGMFFILFCCMWEICRAKKCEVYFKELVDLTVTKSEAGYDDNQRSETTPMLKANAVSCSFAVASDQSGDKLQVASERHKRWNIYTALVPDVIDYHLANYIAQDWKMLGRQLCISSSVLQSIDHEHNSLHERVMAMLLIWRRKFGKEATMKVLTEALKRIARKDLSDKILALAEVELAPTEGGLDRWSSDTSLC